MIQAREGAEEMLSSILNKAIFWQNHSQAILNDRQKKVLNIYLDGYVGKLTTKNWAKHTKTSPDTAARDIKQLIDMGILIPQEGKFRNVPYGIVISKDMILTPGPEDGEE